MTDHDKELFNIVKESYDKRNAERMMKWTKLTASTPYVPFHSLASVNDEGMCGLRSYDFNVEIVCYTDDGIVCVFKYDTLFNKFDGIVEEKSKFPYGKKQKHIETINRFLKQIRMQRTLNDVVLSLSHTGICYTARLMNVTLDDGNDMTVSVIVFPREDGLDVSKWTD